MSWGVTVLSDSAKKNRRIPLVVILTLMAVAVSVPLLSDTSKPEIVNHAVLDAWCEKAWNDMMNQKEGRFTDARLIGNMMRGAC